MFAWEGKQDFPSPGNIMKPIETEREVMKNKKKEKAVIFKKSFSFKSIRDFFRKLAGLSLLMLIGCCPHFIKCIP
jgi:hypothetical protein